MSLAYTWRDHAACVGTPTALFFPPEYPRGRSRVRQPRADVYAPVRHLCASCPVRRECLQEALVEDMILGFRAGYTPDELRNIASARRASS